MYDGYLVKIGASEIPTKYIAIASYYATPMQRQDLDSFRDNKGILHRDVVENMPSKVEFKLRAGLSEEEVREVTSIFDRNYTVRAERKALVEFYDLSTGMYCQEYMYLKDPKYQLDYIDEETGMPYYKEIQYILTGY